MQLRKAQFANVVLNMFKTTSICAQVDEEHIETIRTMQTNQTRWKHTRSEQINSHIR